MATQNFTLDTLYSILSYDPDTGIFTWRVNRRGHVKAGGIVGSSKGNGYLEAKVAGKKLLLHRLAWLYVHGEWPKGHIDHINHVVTDNRIVNLRDVSRNINMQNMIKAKAHNKIGLLGVCKHGLKYRAQITVDKKKILIGGFDSPELAHAAYLAEKAKRHPGSTL
jgi:hypothetical protein